MFLLAPALPAVGKNSVLLPHAYHGGGVGLGWGGAATFMLTCAHCGCYARDVSRKGCETLPHWGGWGGVERGHNVHLPAIIPVILPTRSWCYTLNLLLERPTRSGCYALEFALGTSKELRHALLEFSRNVRRCNGQTLKGGTQTLDKCWDCWKDFIPKVSTKDPKTTLLSTCGIGFTNGNGSYNRHKLRQMVPQGMRHFNGD